MEHKYNDIYQPISEDALSRIPAAMKAAPRWVIWGGLKIPVNGNVKNADGFFIGADWADSTSWMTYDSAVALIGSKCLVRGEYFHAAGVGFVVGDGWFCIDADGGPGHGREPVSEEVVSDLCNRSGTYAEMSISRNGCHVFGLCNFITEEGKEHYSESKTSYEIEFFTRRKFLIVTGDNIPGSAEDVVECSTAARQIYEDYVLTGCNKREAEEKVRREQYKSSTTIDPDDAEQFFLLNYPRILQYANVDHFKRGGKGGTLAPGEYSWIGAIKAMDEIGIPRTVIYDWCRPGASFAGEKDIDRVLDEKRSSSKKASTASIVKDAIENGMPKAGLMLTGEYKAMYDEAHRTTQPITEIIHGITTHLANPAAAAPEEKPEWLIVREWQGREIRRIDEPKFSQMFQDEYRVNRINGVFYVAGSEVQDDYILMLIQRKIAVYFKENTGKLTREVFITLSNEVYTHQQQPDESKIYCRNGITINVQADGSFETVEEDLFTLTRIGADYNPSATCPTFTQYLNDLFYEEDIPAVQEYIGYCLIPSTRAQAGMFIKGKGGEGKSVLRDVIMALFGLSAIQEYIHELGERFTIANLENKLIVIDDDLQTDLLKDTSTLKKLITARERFQVERKLKTKYDAYLYARIIAIGNTFIGSKFDHSDGFYRRQLLIDVKPKTREEKDDDRFMSDKCIKEISGILNWALDGLARLIKNNYHFSVSERMARTLDNIKHDGDNTLTFIEDDIYIEITNDKRDRTTTADLFTLYAAWCSDNGDTPIKRKSFQMRMSERFKDSKIRIRSTEGNLQGYSGIRLTDHAELRLSRITEKERERIARLP